MFSRTALVLALALGLAAPAFSQAKPETDEQKTVYLDRRRPRAEPAALLPDSRQR